jgi:hypothetical protein
MRGVTQKALCVAAALGACAALAGPASAGPIFYTKAAIGEVGQPVKFTGTLGAAFLEGKSSKAKITCVGGTSNGEAATSTTAKNGTVTFTGCETAGLPCNSAGEASGVIKTFTLAGEIGALSSTLPGARLFSQAEGRGGKLAEFQCGGGLVTVVVTGSVIGSLSGASGNTVAEGKIPTSGKLTFAESGGAQKYTKFVGESEGEQLTSTVNGSPELGGQSVIATLKSVPAGNLGYTK